MRLRAAPAALALLGACLLQAGGLWLDVPFIKQEENGCGSAALAMVIRYWSLRGAQVEAAPGIEVRIQQELYSPADRGIPAVAMQRFIEDHGFRALAFRAEWSDLRDHLAKGRPLIVCLGTNGKLLHYVVLAGLDDDSVAINDPADRKLRRVDRAEFEKQWRRAGYWTLLAVPRPPS